MRSLFGLVLVAFACGVCALQTRAALPAYPATIATVGALALLALATVTAPRRLPFAFIAVLACVAGFFSGFGYAAWRADARLAEALPVEWEGEDIRLVGVVDDLPAASTRGARFAFAVERVLTPRAIGKTMRRKKSRSSARASGGRSPFASSDRMAPSIREGSISKRGCCSKVFARPAMCAATKATSGRMSLPVAGATTSSGRASAFARGSIARYPMHLMPA